MYIRTETGALLNLNTTHILKCRKEADRQNGDYTGKYEVVAETDQKVYIIQTVSTERDALDIVKTIRNSLLETGHTVLELPEEIPY